MHAVHVTVYLVSRSMLLLWVVCVWNQPHRCGLCIRLCLFSPNPLT
jgi:hypothetical protein